MLPDNPVTGCAGLRRDVTTPPHETTGSRLYALTAHCWGWLRTARRPSRGLLGKRKISYAKTIFLTDSFVRKANSKMICDSSPSKRKRLRHKMGTFKKDPNVEAGKILIFPEEMLTGCGA